METETEARKVKSNSVKSNAVSSYPLWLSNTAIARLEEERRMKKDATRATLASRRSLPSPSAAATAQVATRGKINKAHAKVSSTVSSAAKHTCATCPMCTMEIIEASGDLDGQDAIFCDGECCQAWYHRWCAGLTKSKFEEQVGSQTPFFCQSCVIDNQNREIASLHDGINSLKSDLADLRTLFNAQLTQLNDHKRLTDPARSADVPAKAKYHPGDRSSELPHKTVDPESAPRSSVVTKHNRDNNRDMDRKHNIVIIGIAECPKGTHRHDRFNMDEQSVVGMLSSLVPTIAPQSIKDCYRLGKYKESNHRPRPLLVQLNRTRDVSQILAKRGSLS